MWFNLNCEEEFKRKSCSSGVHDKSRRGWAGMMRWTENLRVAEGHSSKGCIAQLKLESSRMK